MKRWYLVVTIFLVFLLFLILVFAGPADEWKECASGGTYLVGNPPAATTFYSGNYLDPYYCCCDELTMTDCNWRTTPPCCTDGDGDYWILEDRDIIECGYSCGPSQTEICLGNNDCNDFNPNINPGITEDGGLCQNSFDDSCDMDNNPSWDEDESTGVDCKDVDCAGENGPIGVCCQQESDCNSVPTGDCGKRSCISNVCNILQDKTLCSATAGCGVFQGSCSIISGSYFCDYLGVNDMCGCDEICVYIGSGYACLNVPCFQPDIIDYCDESTGMTCASAPYQLIPPGGVFTLGPEPCTEYYVGFNTCICHGCETCPSAVGGSTGIGGGICSI